MCSLENIISWEKVVFGDSGQLVWIIAVIILTVIGYAAEYIWEYMSPGKSSEHKIDYPTLGRLRGLVGRDGVNVTPLNPVGLVMIEGYLLIAYSTVPINAPGHRVAVRRIDFFSNLFVEPDIDHAAAKWSWWSALLGRNAARSAINVNRAREYLAQQAVEKRLDDLASQRKIIKTRNCEKSG